MVYKVADILRDVRIAMDNNGIEPKLLSAKDTDTLELDDIIRGVIVDAIKVVEMSAPLQYIDSGYNFAKDNPQLYWNGDGSGKVLLPTDFMRLIVFRMSDWSRPVYTAISETDAQYVLQSSRFKGVRGNAQKPVCAIVKRPEGNVLEYYSSNSESATIDSAVYLPLPKIEEDGVEISERCYKAVVYQCGAMALTILNDNRANSLAELAKAMIL